LKFGHRRSRWKRILLVRSARWIRRFRAAGVGFESQRYLARWLFLSSSIGIVAGLGSVIFYSSIEWCTQIFLGRIVGYMPPSPVGEGASTITPMLRPWILPLVTTLGGAISGLIVFKLAPEAEGHGTDAAIEAIHKKRGFIRARIPAVKLLASAITIGSGGSAGREGPAAQISAGFGSLLGKWLDLDTQHRRIAIAAGIGSGIGSIFRAPLGGALLSAEILYIHDLEVEALIPGLISSIVGYSIFGAFFGYTPIFGDQIQIRFNHPIQLLYYAILGLACGILGIIYAKSFYGIHNLFKKLVLPLWMKPALGGLLVGLMGLALPQCLHMGYGWVQIAMGPESNLLPLWIILILPFAKILSTSFSISSGGSGGIFGPGMVIGGMLGASFWRLFHTMFVGMPSNPTPFVIIGMMAMFGGIAHAPLAVMLMVAEMTGNLSLLAPAMVAVAISTALAGDNTIYRSQVLDRASSPVHRLRFSFPLLSSLLVRDAITPCEPAADANLACSDAAGLFDRESSSELVVVDETKRYAGLVTRQQVDQIPPEMRMSTPLGRVVDSGSLALDPDEHLDVALEKLTHSGLSWAPVVEDGHVVGKLTVKDSITTYRHTLERSVRRTNALPGNTALLEARLSASSPLAGKTLRDARFPADTLLVSIARKGETIFPSADTRLEAGDLVVIMADPASEDTLRAFLGDAAANR
jgi:CIC family chloride channel protein